MHPPRLPLAVILALVWLLTPALVRLSRTLGGTGWGGFLTPSLHVVDVGVGVSRRSSGAGACV